eukprot:m.131500 g.131500  ORF g.131500 m.131500 type:complete len:99 (-) comp9477_c1_seq18:2585-2881(-)
MSLSQQTIWDNEDFEVDEEGETKLSPLQKLDTMNMLSNPSKQPKKKKKNGKKDTNKQKPRPRKQHARRQKLAEVKNRRPIPHHFLHDAVMETRQHIEA